MIRSVLPLLVLLITMIKSEMIDLSDYEYPRKIENEKMKRIVLIH